MGAEGCVGKMASYAQLLSPLSSAGSGPGVVPEPFCGLGSIGALSLRATGSRELIGVL